MLLPSIRKPLLVMPAAPTTPALFLSSSPSFRALSWRHSPLATFFRSCSFLLSPDLPSRHSVRVASRSFAVSPCLQKSSSASSALLFVLHLLVHLVAWPSLSPATAL